MAKYSMFQFTHPGRGATEIMVKLGIYQKFQFTHPGRGATIAPRHVVDTREEVSIHAPREGCDLSFLSRFIPSLGFNSRTPGGVRRRSVSLSSCIRGFNSRTPGGVRRHTRQVQQRLIDVSIHAPREGCDEIIPRAHACPLVSIHAPREGCDKALTSSDIAKVCFNSRTPGGVRQCGAKLRIIGRINKRNLREGRWKGREGARLLLWFWLCS